MRRLSQDFFRATLSYECTVDIHALRHTLLWETSLDWHVREVQFPPMGVIAQFEITLMQVDAVFHLGHIASIRDHVTHVASSEYVDQIPQALSLVARPDDMGRIRPHIIGLANGARAHTYKAAGATRPLVVIQADTLGEWQMARRRLLAHSIPGIILRRPA